MNAGDLTLVAVTAVIHGPDKLRARVEYEGRRELWPVGRDDARNIVGQFTAQVEAKSMVPGGEEKLILTREPVLVELPKPPSDEIHPGGVASIPPNPQWAYYARSRIPSLAVPGLRLLRSSQRGRAAR